ncbi:MAG TPA: SpaH/EbpB family LPXTG-anchored major pilin [Candidatus Olsenella pullicola]|nr:SpaH/EbpB family LPXTG-anchored major pilin [Candidatus Olsenella pullicola]
MAHIKNRLRGLLAAFVALVAALAIVPGMAFALTNGSTGTVTISGFDSDDTVTLYKVVDTTYDADHNTIDHAWNANVKDYMESTAHLTIDQYEALADDATGEGETAASIRAALNAAIEGGSAQGIPTENVGGTVTASGLTMGQYYVLVQTAEGSLRTYQHMIVSVQPTAQADGSWSEPVLGDRIDQPKYTEETVVEKDITGDEPSKGYLPGTEVEFTITTAIPSYALNTNWDETSFTITDTRTNLVAPADDAYAITVGGVPVEMGTDYTVVTDGNATTITFSGSFLQNHQNEDVVVTYTATVAGELDHTEPIENQAVVNPGNGTETDPDTVTLELYKVTGKKVDSEDKSPLQGAVFSIYRESNDIPGFQAEGDTLIKEGITSGPDGSFEYDPLADGEYYLVETKAPAGYELLDGAVAFSTDDANDDNVITLTDVKNDEDSGIHLPQTGGAGTIALTAAGVVLVAGAAAFIVRSRKEN